MASDGLTKKQERVGSKVEGRISKRVFQETKHVKFCEKRTFLTPGYAQVFELNIRLKWVKNIHAIS